MVKLNNFQPNSPASFQANTAQNQPNQFPSPLNQALFPEQPAQNQALFQSNQVPPKGLFQIPEKFLQLIP
jgi:hypothetical protein